LGDWTQYDLELAPAPPLVLGTHSLVQYFSGTGGFTAPPPQDTYERRQIINRLIMLLHRLQKSLNNMIV
jgi:hypothetical protein